MDPTPMMTRTPVAPRVGADPALAEAVVSSPVTDAYRMPPTAAERFIASVGHDLLAQVDRLDAWIDELATGVADDGDIAAARVRVVRNLPDAWAVDDTVTPDDDVPIAFVSALTASTPSLTPTASPKPMEPAEFGPIITTTATGAIMRRLRRRPQPERSL